MHYPDLAAASRASQNRGSRDFSHTDIPKCRLAKSFYQCIVDVSCHLHNAASTEPGKLAFNEALQFLCVSYHRCEFGRIRN